MRKEVLFYVAEYIRLSKEDGDKAESDSIGNQRKLIADFLKGKEEFILYDVYIEMKITNLIQPAKTEYRKNRRNKGFFLSKNITLE